VIWWYLKYWPIGTMAHGVVYVSPMQSLALRGKTIQITACYPDHIVAYGWVWVDEWLTPHKSDILKHYFGL
jgi:hypothetical protein